MKQKDENILLAVLGRQSAESAKLADSADKSGDRTAHAFQSGAHAALSRAIEYVKDARAGILTEAT